MSSWEGVELELDVLFGEQYGRAFSFWTLRLQWIGTMKRLHHCILWLHYCGRLNTFSRSGNKYFVGGFNGSGYHPNAADHCGAESRMKQYSAVSQSKRFMYTTSGPRIASGSGP